MDAEINKDGVLRVVVNPGDAIFDAEGRTFSPKDGEPVHLSRTLSASELKKLGWGLAYVNTRGNHVQT